MAPRIKSVKTLKDDMEKKAKAMGLTENYIFVNLWKGYQDQLSICNELLKLIGSAYMVEQPAGKDATKKVVNPAVSEYNRMATLANKSAAQLVTMFEKAQADQEARAPADKDEEDDRL